MESVELTFAHTEQEYLAAVRSLYFHSKEAVVRLAIFFVSSVVVLLGLSVVMGLSLPVWLLFGFIVLIAVGGYHGLTIDIPRRVFRGDPKYREEYRIVFSDSGIEFETKSIKASYAWSVYTKVVENQTFYLMLYGKNINQITIVPKRAFRDSRQEATFRELLSRHVSERVAMKEVKEPEYVPTSLEPPDWR